MNKMCIIAITALIIPTFSHSMRKKTRRTPRKPSTYKRLIDQTRQQPQARKNLAQTIKRAAKSLERGMNSLKKAFLVNRNSRATS